MGPPAVLDDGDLELANYSAVFVQPFGNACAKAIVENQLTP
jgi:hypothetical protein